MASLKCLDTSSLDHIVSFLEQNDAIALHTSSKAFRDVYPRHITKVFKLDASIDDYVTFCRWIANRAIDTLEVCVDITKWKAVIPFNLSESSFEHVTVCSNSLRDICETPRFPACRSQKSGFLDRTVQKTSNSCESSLYLYVLPDPGRVRSRMPYFASEIFGTPNTLNSLSCNGTLENLDRIPHDITRIYFSNAAIDQRMLDDMAKLDVFKMSIKECQVRDSTIQPRTFTADHLYISLNILSLIKDTGRFTTFIEIECDGTIPHVERDGTIPHYPVLEHVLTVRITGRCQSLVAVGALVARSFPNATPQFHFMVTPV